MSYVVHCDPLLDADNAQDYLPGDLKGKGEPSFSIEEAEKRKAREQQMNGQGNSYELAERPRHSSARRSRTGSNPEGSSVAGQSYADWEIQRRKSHSRNISGDLRKRVGLKRQEV